MIPFGQRLALAVAQKKNPVCVGIDPRASSLPEALNPGPNASLESIVQSIENFSLQIIDAVADLVPVIKPQCAFFEELGPLGMLALHKVAHRSEP